MCILTLLPPPVGMGKCNNTYIYAYYWNPTIPLRPENARSRARTSRFASSRKRAPWTKNEENQ